jgi:hypothetical protein
MLPLVVDVARAVTGGPQAYLGPDNVMPVASFLAAAAGVVLLFGNRILAAGQRLFRRSEGPASEASPDEASLADPTEPPPG